MPHRTRSPRGTILAILVVLLLPANALAVEYTAARKLGRGLAAMTTSFLEIPGNMVEQSRERGSAQGLPIGFAIGLGMIVPRVLIGVYETVTAPFEVPDGFRPILEPEFPWGYFEEPPPR